jgi:hypothetical protein
VEVILETNAGEVMKDAKGHGSSKKGIATDPEKRARQLAHIAAHYANKGSRNDGGKTAAEVGADHGIPVAHLDYDPKAAEEFGRAVEELRNYEHAQDFVKARYGDFA